MEYVRFGLTDLRISRIGMGCAAIGGYDYGAVEDKESIAAVQRALDLGISLFDTADVYGLGHSEEVLSQALGGRRHEVVIATKFGVGWSQDGKTFRDLSGRRAVQALEGSLRRLKLDCIPVYQVHWPDSKTPLAETFEALKRCQEAGKVRYVGCCNFPHSLVEEVQDLCRVESLQVPFSLAERDYWETIRLCRDRHTMTTLAYNPLAQGLFTGKYGAQSKFEGTDLRRRSELFQGDKLKANLAILDRLRLVGDRHGRTPAQVALRWILEDPADVCVLVGIKTATQAEQNAGGAGWTLSPEEVEFLTGGKAAVESSAHGLA